jgi:predicted O-linked N-acetylglucosamine transferase (SPINDLY family)
MLSAKANQLLHTAVAHHQAGRFAEAERLYAKVCIAAPQSFDAFHLSGWVALQQARPHDAVVRLTHASKLNPRSGLCALRLAHALKKMGRLPEARSAANRAAALEPADADAHFCAGDLAAATESFAAAVPHFRRVTELQPAAPDGWANLGVALAQSGGRAEALRCFGRALSLEPANVQALTGRALVLQETHRTLEAIEAYAAVLQQQPANHQARSGRLLTLHYVDALTREQMFAEHQAFGQVVGPASSGVTFPNSRDPARKLRVAFLSPDLRAHSVAYFLEPLIANLDREQFEALLYHDHAKVDAMSDRLRGYAATWRNFAGQVAATVEASIRSDAPDILIDLAGHTGLNRLPLFARRLAPVQVTYLGYPDTTGVAEIDYRFVDGTTDPQGNADAFATERLVRFARTAWAFAPPVNAPEPSPCPGATGGAVTFGCFNNFAKVTEAMLRNWAAVLEGIPDSRLLLKAGGLETPAEQARVRAEFAAFGIAPQRIEMLGRLPGIAAHLTAYGRVDVALDTFPYNGTTTTCEALWMGVPVVTLAGEHHMSRVGASLLEAVGHPEWIAYNRDEYVRIATRLACDLPRLAAARTDLRGELERSPLLDHLGQAQRFGAALRQCWSKWCRRSA